MARFLMCPPQYFGIEYEINPWMRVSDQADLPRAKRQWGELHRVLTEELGVAVELLEPAPGLPDLVFTANAGYVAGDLFISSAFKFPQRQRETPHFEAWFATRGFTVRRPPPGCPFDGTGDALPLGDTVFASYRHRSEICAHRLLSEALGRLVLSLELVDPRFYHLDTCFCPLSGEAVLYYPRVFDAYGRRVIEENVPAAGRVGEGAAGRFACNAAVVDGDVILNAGCADVEAELASRGYRVFPVDLSEFMKSGGSAKCLTLRLD